MVWFVFSWNSTQSTQTCLRTDEFLFQFCLQSASKYWEYIYLYSTFFFSISSHLSWLDSSDYDYQTNIDELEWEECSYSPRAHTVDLERMLQWMQQLEKTQIRLSVFILGRFELLRAQWNRFRRSSLHFEPFFCMKSYILRLCWKVSRP